jgi:hypothetical protein
MKNPHTVQNMVRRRVRRRRMVRRLRVGVLVVAVVLASGGAAFGIDRMVVSLHRYYSSGPHRTTTTTTVAPVTTTTQAGPPGCVGGQLTGTVPNWRSSSGSMYEIVELTNVSLTPCRLEGYPLLAVNSSNGTALPAAAQEVATLGQAPVGADTSPGIGVSSQPTGAGPVPVVVAPRQRSWFELAYGDVCDQILAPGSGPTTGNDVCYGGSILQITPPHTASPIIVTEPVRLNYQVAGFQVGPFEPGDPPGEVPIPS